ncbi:hypothetical protein BRD08_07365 [Halobacteriales archaeon SW_10_66_29]|nr:MAG: hypothetical protein BRD08_07365 [Halobacteriales archaeon SW_10_66_29]
MARADDTELIDSFEEFYRSYYRNEIGELAQKYPNEEKSLYVDWQDLYRFDPDLADDFRNKPTQLLEYAEEALRLYDLPVDVSLGQAHVRVHNLPQTTDIRAIRSDHRGMLIQIQGIVRKATDVRPKITTAAFECQRCGTLTRIPQDGDFQEPHECQGCERQGPFRINYDQSEFIDAQKLRVQESPEGLRGGETPQNIDVNIEDDITGEVTAGDHVSVSGILKLEQQGGDREKSPMFDIYMDGMTVEIEDEQFEEMDITDEDKKEIVELSNTPDIYEQMEGAIAPSIYGFEMEKRAMIFQLFSGVTKFLPDESRTRGDLHILLVGDPGTGKSALLQYINNIAPRSVYTSGKGSSAAGLTAAAVRDDFAEGQQWTLEAGALVLADQGIAAVDELDKMRCVTGDTLVHTPGGKKPIKEFATEWERSGSIEQLANGRTIRGVDAEVHTMTDAGTIKRRAVTAVHEYRSPDTLYRVTLESGDSVTTTADHPFIVHVDGKRATKPATALDRGDYVYVPDAERHSVTDGGMTTTADSVSPNGGDHHDEVTSCRVVSVEAVSAENDTDSSVYDLTVEGTHNFVANGMVIHNSEDQSAMHEALEQQSYHPNSEVLLADGRRVEIGEFVDGKMAAAPDSVVDGVDCEILPVEDVGVHTVDLESNEVRKTEVDRVSRHEAPEEFVRVEFSNGREVLVTPEHPMFVEDDGSVGTVEARAIDEGAFVPAPRKLPNSAQPVSLDGETQVGKEKDVDLPAELSPKLGEILGFLVAEGHSYAGSSHEIGFSNQDERLLDRMDRLMSSVFGMESSDTTNAAGTITKRWTSTKLYRWFESNVPEVMHTAREKRIPAAVLGASEGVIRRFLVGAFAGDGGVESEAMSFSTASEGLAEDYADALTKIGVASRIHYDTAEDSWKTYVMGDSTEQFVEQVVDPADPRHDDAHVLPTSAARELRELRRLLGLRLTGRFKPNLDEEYGVQVETVRNELATLRERVDEVRQSLDGAEELADIRAAIDWSGRRLAEDIDGETSSSIHYAESGGYDERRRETLAEQARDVVRGALDAAERRIDALEERKSLRYYRVTNVETVPNEGEYACEWVYDVTVEPTNTFVSQGVVLHNSISVSKAGINATLKSRCSLLGAANPTYGRFDEYEPIGEQIDLAPPLISRFDLIFTVTDQPDEEKDAELAEHILQTNYAGELNTHREETSTSNYSLEEVERVTEDVAPTIDPELLRKYVAYAKRNCYPTMTEEAKDEIQEYYVKLRTRGEAEDAPVPVTARKLEALVRLAEASARVRLSDTVEADDAQRAIDIAQYCLEDIGLDPETGELDADMIETGTSKSQRDRIMNIKSLIETIEEEYDEGAPVDVIVERAEEQGMDASKAEHEIDKLKQKGEVYEPKTDHLRTT